MLLGSWFIYVTLWSASTCVRWINCTLIIRLVWNSSPVQSRGSSFSPGLDADGGLSDELIPVRAKQQPPLGDNTRTLEALFTNRGKWRRFLLLIQTTSARGFTQHWERLDETSLSSLQLKKPLIWGEVTNFPMGILGNTRHQHLP